MNEVIENIKSRRSTRKYKKDMVPDNIINQIVEAGTYAPTGMNRQSPIIIIVKNKDVRDKISKLNAKIMGNEKIDPFYGAPIVLIVLADKNCPTYIYDGSIVIQNLMLAAHSLDVDSCWIHRAKEEFETDEGKEILKELGIEGNYEGIGHCILGYIDGEEKPIQPRKENYVYTIN